MEGRGRFPVPDAFRLDREKPAGKYPLLDVFGGLTDVPPFRDYPGVLETNREVARTSFARIYDGRGYMYLAPRTVPAEIRAAGFEMITSPEEEIVVARAHLTESPVLDVYLDVLHEFLHILQRKDGRELWPGLAVPYVDRPTEIEGYAFSLREARRLGVPDGYLRQYLRVFWVTRTEYHRLLGHLGVSVPKRRASARPPGRLKGRGRR